MDKRKRLEAGTVLPFSGMECEIDSVVGCGANAMVYRGHYRDLQKQELFHQVLIKELFPYEPDGKIYRGENGKICVQPDAKTQMELHRLSFQRGNEVHLRVLMQHPGEIDFNINTFELNDTLYTVLGFSGGRSLEQEWEKRKEQSLTELIGRIKKALEALGFPLNMRYADTTEGRLIPIPQPRPAEDFFFGCRADGRSALLVRFAAVWATVRQRLCFKAVFC